MKVNPSHIIKLQNHYVECCCVEDVRKEILEKLKAIEGVWQVKHLTASEGAG